MHVCDLLRPTPCAAIYFQDQYSPSKQARSNTFHSYHKTKTGHTRRKMRRILSQCGENCCFPHRKHSKASLRKMQVLRASKNPALRGGKMLALGAGTLRRSAPHLEFFSALRRCYHLEGHVYFGQTLVFQHTMKSGSRSHCIYPLPIKM